MSRTLALALVLFAPASALADQASAPPAIELLGEVSATFADMDRDTCAGKLEATFASLRAFDTTALDATFVDAHPRALADVWVVQRQGVDALRALHEEGPVDEACVDGVRRVDVALRTAADHLLMATQDASPWLGTAELTSFEGLRSGDVLVTRGGALSSAGIAHFGAVDSSFSHNALVYVDTHGDAWTVEAYLEKGGLVQPLGAFLDHGLGRVVVLRYEDEATAAKAAHLAYQRVAHGPAIPYDEAFDSSSHEELFCSEIMPWALGLAGGPTDVPLHRTRFDHDATPELFDAMGIEVPDLAAPADLMFDPRFRVVGEWRDLNALPELHRQDAVVDGMFRWMMEQDVALVPSWTHKATVDVGLAARRTPLLRAAVRERLHPDGDRQFLVAALALQDAGQRLYDTVEADVGGPEVPMPRAALDARIEVLLSEDATDAGRRGHRGGVSRVLRPTGRK